MDLASGAFSQFIPFRILLEASIPDGHGLIFGVFLTGFNNRKSTQRSRTIAEGKTSMFWQTHKVCYKTSAVLS
jgi:hypothetical protein